MTRWPMVPLGKILREEKRRVGTIDADNLPLLGVSNAEGLHRSGLARINDMSRYLRVEHSWFAYNPMRINVGSIGWAREENQTGVISPDYVVFSCTEEVCPELVYWFLKHWRGLQAINAETAGSVRERLYFESLARIQFPLAPLDQQQPLVAKIQSLAAKIEIAKELKKRAAAEAAALLTAAITATARRLSLTARLGDVLLKKPKNGWSARCNGSGTAVLSLGAVTGFRYRSDQFKRTSQPIDPGAHYWLREGDLLITRSNTPEFVGHAAIYNGHPSPCIYPDLMMRLEVDEHRADTKFVSYLLRSGQTREYIQRNAKGTSPTMKKISQEVVMGIPFPDSLPLEEQSHIVSGLDALEAGTDELRKDQAEATAGLDALLPAALDRLFRGEL